MTSACPASSSLDTLLSEWGTWSTSWRAGARTLPTASSSQVRHQSVYRKNVVHFMKYWSQNPANCVIFTGTWSFGVQEECCPLHEVQEPEPCQQRHLHRYVVSRCKGRMLSTSWRTGARTLPTASSSQVHHGQLVYRKNIVHFVENWIQNPAKCIIFTGTSSVGVQEE